MATTLGRRLHGARIESGFATQQELGDLIGLSDRQVRNYETDRVKRFNIAALQRWAEVTNKPLEYFLQALPSPVTRIRPDGLPEGAQPIEGLSLVPLLGRVTAGPGGVAEEHIEGYRHVPSTWVPPGQEQSCFLVQARGESMVDAGISSGDQLLVCTAVAVNDGDVAIIEVDGEAMVKRVFRQGHQLLVTSDNPSFKPFTVGKARIIGRVMKIMRDV